MGSGTNSTVTGADLKHIDSLAKKRSAESLGNLETSVGKQLRRDGGILRHFGR